MMRKKAWMIVLIVILIIATCSMTYIFAIDSYDTMPDKMQKILQQIETLEEITYKEADIKMSAIQYNKELTKEDLQAMNDAMSTQLAHDSGCSPLTTFSENKNLVQITSSEGDEEWNYEFKLKEQQDIHHNVYYDLKIVGSKDIEKVDTLRNRAKAQFKEWGIRPKESIYFKATIAGKVSKQETNEIAEQLFERLDAKKTNYYEDDLEETTCVYYGYSSWFKEYIQEQDGDKTNMQVGFKYNDELNRTELTIAFPFYNEPF